MRTWVLLGSAVAALAWVTATLVTKATPLIATLPTVLTVFALVLLDNGYLWGRRLAHRVRRRHSTAKRTSWTPGKDVRNPNTYPPYAVPPTPADPIDQQGRFRAVGIRISILPFLAVALLTAQAVFRKDGGPLAIGLVAAECVVLIVLVWTVWSRTEPSRPWTTSRLRTELLRRESFLALIGAGPYLGLDEDATRTARDARYNLLASASTSELKGFLAMSDRVTAGVETSWHDEVWTRPVDAHRDLADCMRTYLDYRIRRQKLFMELAIERCKGSDGALGWTAKATVLAGIAAALGYAILLIMTRKGASEPETVVAAIAVLTASIPALCNSVLAIQNLYAFQRLASSYDETSQELLYHENSLSALIAKPPTDPTGAVDSVEASKRFRALALRVEQTLTEEHRRWRVIVARPEFDAGM